LPNAARIDADHALGQATVHAFLSRRPLAPDDVRALFNRRGSRSSGVIHIEREILVIPAVDEG
jgi:hypothetical protein